MKRRRLYVVVVQRRLRNVQKSVMHEQSCFFCQSKPIAFLPFSLPSPSPSSMHKLLNQKTLKSPFTNFSPDFTLHRQIWLFYVENWIFLKNLGTLLNENVSGIRLKPLSPLLPSASLGIRICFFVLRKLFNYS